MLQRIIVICLAVILYDGISLPASAADIRAAVVSGQYTAEISCDNDFMVVDTVTGESTAMAKGKYFLSANNGVLKLNDRLFAHPIRFTVEADGVMPQINKKSYDGSLRASVNNGRILITNELDLEDYLCSVVSSKTMVIWPDEAIKAQIVAARSYAVHMMLQNSAEAYDISSTDEELPYAGNTAKKSAVSSLVKATAGQVLTDKTGNVIKAVTTAGSGGKTESALGAWGYDVSYLQSVEDYDQDCPDYKWEYKISPILLQTLLEQAGYGVGKLVSISLSPLQSKGHDRTDTGHVRNIVISGEDGTASLSGQELMKLLSLNSTYFDLVITTPLPDNLEVPIENYFGMEIGRKDIKIHIDDKEKAVWNNTYSSYHLFSGGKDEKVVFSGFGKGSGVGLSIWGAKGMADRSPANNYVKILKHYYQGTSLKIL